MSGLSETESKMLRGACHEGVPWEERERVVEAVVAARVAEVGAADRATLAKAWDAGYAEAVRDAAAGRLGAVHPGNPYGAALAGPEGGAG